ncbi:F-box domain and ankyrin repeat protein [Arthroderma uncinatum]|uniref:F-box domain and ankyrin repeat protein n=1 Tax=Arthroderma uncinatum TaxID=74035 RepID=UPI00144AD3F3|nr:F-box domain and ankyrin repeat protein [Arthroderma uncinatum]KAF3481463.1 F-box domain and ankyrin repeat protein [Arthroderma uncinatum]
MVAEAVAANCRRGEIQAEEELQNFDEVDPTYNILCGAIVIGNISIVKSMAASVDINSFNDFFGKPLPLAAVWGHLEIVQYLLDHGADPYVAAGSWDHNRPGIQIMGIGVAIHEYRDPKGSALAAATLGGHWEIVFLLLQPKFRLPPSTAEYFRAILCGVRIDRMDLIDLLLQAAGHSLGSLGKFRDLMLWEAVCHNLESMVQTLLDHGADINRDPYGDGTVLHLAAHLGYDRLVRALLDRGAELDNPYCRSRIPMELAAYGGHEEAVLTLAEYGQKLEIALPYAAQNGRFI